MNYINIDKHVAKYVVVDIKDVMFSFNELLVYIYDLKKKENKAISMMRGKSPRSDVEMSKKLNFVAAILEFWQPFLNQF